MKKMKPETEMKEKIYNAAKVLFYENGYIKTTYKQLGEAVNGNGALVAYYYGSKGKLATLVYNEYMNRIKNMVREQFNINNISYDVLLATAIEIRVHGSLMSTNRNLNLFYWEIMNENIQIKEEAVNEEYFQELVKICKLDLPIYKLKLLNYGEFGFRQATCLAHQMGKVDCSYKEFTDAAIETLLLLLRQVDRIDEILAVSEEFEKNMPELAIKKNFVIDFK
ncbi:TetR/AcrR family transcriptional regulator [Acetobacterium carbinolicum]|jgi:hypothetical protein|uniref:TetR/AcrR family transcriptional regulator n=1 Tax=Acetobacterium carbinolicum TaxID=52690 RepID=UPI0039BEDD16